MKVRALREFYGHPGEVRANEEIHVTRSTGNELVANGLVEIVDDSEEDAEVEKREQGAKEAQAPANKAAPAPKNKAQQPTQNKD